MSVWTRIAAGLIAGAALWRRRRGRAAPERHGSGLPVPRFVSLKSDKVNVRAGPTKDHDVAWVYNRAGLPVEVTAEFENWRRIRDWEGAEGWVYHSLLSGRRTALVAPLQEQGRAARRCATSRTPRAPSTAQLQPGVLGDGEALQRRLVPPHRRRLRRLDRAGAPVGRLSERKGRVAEMHDAPPRRGIESPRLASSALACSAAPPRRRGRSRSLPARAASCRRITSAPGMSTSSFSPSTKK